MTTRPANTNLVTWLDFASSDDLLTDEIGTFENGDLVAAGAGGGAGVTYSAAGLNGGALSIDGTDYVQSEIFSAAQENALAFSASGPQARDMSIVIWWNTSVADNLDALLFLYTNNTVALRKTAGDATFISIYNESAGALTNLVHDTDSLSASTWYCSVIRIENATDGDYAIKLMNDGVENTGAFAGGDSIRRDDTTRFAIGLFGSGRFNGLIDSIAIWREWLTDDNLDYLYNSGAGKSYAAYVADGIPEVEDEPETTDFSQTAIQSFPIGGNPLATVADAFEDHSLSVSFSNNFDLLSNNFCMLGGIPCTLYTNSSGDYALGVWNTTHDTSKHSQRYVYKGTRFAVHLDTAGRRYFVVTGENGSATVAYKTVWQGIPLSVNENNQLIMKQVGGTPTAYKTAAIGGMPLTFAQINGRWYLAVKDA